MKFNIIPESGPPPPRGSGLLAGLVLLFIAGVVALVGSRLGWW